MDALFWAVLAFAVLATVAALHPQGHAIAVRACFGLWIAVTLTIIIRS